MTPWERSEYLAGWTSMARDVDPHRWDRYLCGRFGARLTAGNSVRVDRIAPTSLPFYLGRADAACASVGG